MLSKLIFNKNWRFIIKKEKLYFFNVVTSKQLEVELCGKKDAILFILQELQKEGIEKDKLRKQFQKSFPEINKEWFNVSINSLQKYGVLSVPRICPSSLNSEYLMGLDRQLDFLEEAFPEEGRFLKQNQLKEAKVTILGLGTIAQYIRLLPK